MAVEMFAVRQVMEPKWSFSAKKSTNNGYIKWIKRLERALHGHSIKPAENSLK